MAIELISLQTIRMVSGVLKRIFHAIDLMANAEGFLQFSPRNRCGDPKMGMEPIEQRYFDLFRHWGRKMCRGHN